MHLHTHDVHNHFTCNSEWFSHLCIFVSFFFYLFLNASFYLPLSLSLDLYLPPSLICTSLCFSDEIYKTKFVRGTLDSMFSLFLFPIYKLYFLSVFLFLSLSHFLSRFDDSDQQNWKAFIFPSVPILFLSINYQAIFFSMLKIGDWSQEMILILNYQHLIWIIF